MREVSTIVGGIGGLIVLYLVLANASSFSTITSAIASNSTGLIQTLQGRGSGSTSFTGVN